MIIGIDPIFSEKREMIHTLANGRKLMNSAGVKFEKISGVEWKVIDFRYSNCKTIDTPTLLVFAGDLEPFKEWYEDAPSPWTFDKETKTLNAIAKSGKLFTIKETGIQNDYLICKLEPTDIMILRGHNNAKTLIEELTKIIHKDHGGWPNYVKQ